MTFEDCYNHYYYSSSSQLLYYGVDGYDGHHRGLESGRWGRSWSRDELGLDERGGEANDDDAAGQQSTERGLVRSKVGIRRVE